MLNVEQTWWKAGTAKAPDTSSIRVTIYYQGCFVFLWILDDLSGAAIDYPLFKNICSEEENN